MIRTFPYVLAFLLGICLTGRILADEPLFEQDPFDQVTLDEANNGAVLKVKPLDLPNRRLPAKPQPDDKLIIRLVDQPGKKYEVAWISIRKVELFEQMLLDKANELAAADKLDEAYDYFHFLDENYSRMPGLAEAHNEFLFKQAKALFGQQKYRNALGVLRELHRRSPQRAKLDIAMGAMTDKLVEQYADHGYMVPAADYASIRGLLRTLAACYPRHPLVAKWETRLRDEAAAHLATAQQAQQSGDLRKAAASIRRVMLLWPALAGAKELAETLHKQYPRVVVGVCQAAPGRSAGGAGSGLDFVSDWAARREARLVSRGLCELTAAGPKGGQYACPIGAVKLGETPRRFTIALNRNAPLGACDVARGLLAMADRADAAYRPEWAEIFEAVSVHDIYQVEIELVEGRLRPQALLETPLASPTSSPYARAEATATEAAYVLNPGYFARTATQPKEIVEQNFADAAAGVAALRRGEIQVLDRVDPWQVKALQADANVTVQSYALPRLHCLVPNARRLLTANRTFRRALAYGIDRQAILEQLLRGNTLPGCVPLHGPMQVGTSPRDPLDYASDPKIEPWPYDPRLALALAEGGRRELAAGGKDQTAAPPSISGRGAGGEGGLVLAYPADDIARAACTAIRQQLAAADIAVELKELPAAPGQVPADVDLLYVELAMWEPLIDAPRVLGENGLAGTCSAQMSEALRQLQQAADWDEVPLRLHRIDRLAHDEVAVVPLWQLPDHFAYRKDLAGIAAGTLTLYQNVEQWKPGFQYPSEK